MRTLTTTRNGETIRLCRGGLAEVVEHAGHLARMSGTRQRVTVHRKNSGFDFEIARAVFVGQEACS